MTFSVTYDPNGATDGAVPDSSQYLAGVLVTVEDNPGNLTKNGLGPLEQTEKFANWNTAADGSGDGYGGAGPHTYTMGTADVTFYAQWFTTAGLTKDPQGNEGLTAHYQFSYDSSLQKSLANPAGIEPDRTNALIAACEGDFAIMKDWFGGILLNPPLTLPVFVQVANLSGGAQAEFTGRSLELNIITLSPGQDSLMPDSDRVGFLRYLMVLEVTELFMYVQGKGKGWFPPFPAPPGDPLNNEGSSGEGLSRFLGQQFLAMSELGYPDNYEVAFRWLDSALIPVVNQYDYGRRSNYVDTTLPWDNGPYPAVGCAVLFIYYLFTQLGFSIKSIVAAAAPTLGGVYSNLTGDTTGAFTAFKQLLDKAFPPDVPADVPGPNPDNPWPLGSARFHPMLIAWTRNDGLTSIGNCVSVNDSGSVAFTGSIGQGNGLFVADGIFSPGGRSQARNINPGFSSDPARRFSEYVQINNAGKVVAQDRETGGLARTFVRAWDSHIPDAYDMIAISGTESYNYDAVMSPASINNYAKAIGGGEVIFPALKGADTYLATPIQPPPPAKACFDKRPCFNSVLRSGAPHPRISDNGQIVVRAGYQASSPIWVYGRGLTGAKPEDVADMGGATPSFSAVGRSPGISADGQIVAFYGDLTQAGAAQWGLTPGPGIFASIQIDSLWTIHRVADAGGDGPAGFVADAPVGVNSVRMFTYLGTDAAGNKGLYMTRLSFFSVSPPFLGPAFRPVAAPTLLAATGSPLELADGSSLGVLQDVNIYDSLNIHGDVAFWVQTDLSFEAVVLVPRGSGSDYRDRVHSTYINAYEAGHASAPYPAGLPRAWSDMQRGGDACGAAALTMLLNAMQYATDLNLPDLRWPLLWVYCATADQPVGDPAPGPDGNNFNWAKGRNYARHYGYKGAKYFNDGKAAIDAQLANNVPVIASTRFGLGTKWSKGHCVLLLSHTPAGPSGGGFYVVDDPAGYVVQTQTGSYGHYGRGQCGEHVIYPEPLVAQALLYPDGKPRYALVLGPAPGTDPDVMLVIGRFDGPGPQPYQLWLEDTSGRQAGWLPGGQQVQDIPDSQAAVSPIVASDPSTVPDAPPDQASWPYAISVASPEDGLRVFVSGNLQAGFSLEALRFTPGGVIRSVTSGTVTQGETQEVTLAAPALYNLTLSAGAGGNVTASPAPGPYPDGTQVAVTAVPDTDHVFAGWTVDGTPGDLTQPLALFMDADHTVTVGFTAATLQSITLSPASPTVTVGAAQQFLATGTYSDGSTADLTAGAAWSTSNTAVATISPAGLATTRQASSVTITAALAGITGAATLTVATPPVLASIAVSPANPSIIAGAGLQLTATGTLSDGTPQDLTPTASWSSSNATTAAVGFTGIVTTTAQPGTATITATAEAVSGSTTITVIAVPVLTAIQVVPLAMGIQQLLAIGTYSDGSTSDLTTSAAWSTSNPTVATVNAAGLATEKQAGSVTIGAAATGISGSASLQVAPPVLQAIVVSPLNPTITAGTALQLTATGVLSDGSTQDLTATASWSSSNPATATIGKTGIANGLQPGGTAVTAAMAGVSGFTSLTVAATPSLQAIAVTPAQPTIAAGGTVQFTATGTLSDGSTLDLTATASWSSSNPATATIGATGIAIALEPGATVITAAAGSISGSTGLTVVPVPSLQAIAVTPARPRIAAGSTVQFTAIGVFTDGSTQDLRSAASWFSGTTAVATIDAAGAASGVAGGITMITATAGGFSGSTSLTVTAVPVLRSIAVTPADPSIAIGATAQFTAAGTYTDGSTADVTSTVTWSSTNVTIATVSAGGLATAVAQGTASITAAAGAISGSAGLTVAPPLTTVTWVGTVSGSWHDPSNWSTGQLPGPFNDVVIDAAAGIVVTYSQGTSAIHSLTSHNDLTLAGGTLALSAPSAISGALTLAGGGLAGSDDVLVSGLFTSTSGQLAGPGTVTAAGGLAISGGELLLVTGCTLVNAGTATWTSGAIALGTGGVIVNGPAAVFDVQFGGSMLNQGEGWPVFSNAGVLRVSAGTGTVSLQTVALDNAGTIDLASGTLTLESDPRRPGSWTGAFTGAAGTTLVFAGPYDLKAGSSLTGAAVTFSAPGPVNIAGSYDVTGATSTTRPASPAVNFTAGAAVTSTGAVTIDSGVLNFSTGQPVTLPGALTLADTGGLAGSDDVLVSGLFTSTSGTLAGPGTVTAAGGLAISGGELLLVTGCTLVNAGTATWTSGAIALGTGGVIVNGPAAVFDVQFGGSMLNQGEGWPVFSNAGVLRVSAGTGTVSLQTVALDNAGTIDLASGTLTLESDPRRPGSWTGAFTGAAGTTLVFAGPYDLKAGSSLTGAAVTFSAPGPVNIAGSYDVTGATSTTRPASPAVNFTAGAAVTSTGAVTIDSGVLNFSTGQPVTLPGALTLADTGGLAGSDDVLVSGLFTSTSGQLAGPGTVTAAGGLAISGGELLLVTGCTLVNAGTATWTSGAIALGTGGVIVNGPAAVFDVQFGGSMLNQGEGWPVFSNAGVLRVSAGTGTVSLQTVALDNAGTIDLASGTLTLESDPRRPGSWTGAFTGAAGTTLVFAGPYDLKAGSSLTGAAVTFSAPGPVNIAGSYDVTGATSTTRPASPAVNFTAGAAVTSTGAVTIDSGVLNFSTGQPVTLPGALTLADTGGLAGSDDVLVSGLFTSTSGQLAGPGTVTAAGGLAISGGELLLVTGCTLVNAGTATWTSGAIALGTGGVIVNGPAAVFDVQFGGSMLNQGEGWPVFSNAGVLRVSAGTGTVSLQTVALDNAGTIDLASGTLTLESDPRRPGSWTGAFTGAAGTTLVFAGPYDLKAGSSLTGAAVTFSAPGPVNIAGSYDVTGATSTTRPASPAVNFTAGAAVTSTGAVTIDSGMLNFSTGQPVTLPGALTLADYGGLAGSDDVLVAGLFTSTSGQLAGPGTVTAAGGLAITQSPSGGAQLLITGCTLVNTGAGTWAAGVINTDNGAVFRNTATATFNVTCDNFFVWCGQTTSDGFCQPIGSRPVFENTGTFTKSAGAGITDFSGNPYSNGGAVAFINAGTVEAQSGQIAFGQTYTQTAGSLRLTGGNVSAFGTLDIQGGALSGTGTVTGNVQNAGALDMGGNLGVLTITGSYTQVPAGQLTARLGGLSAGTQYDQLVVAGAASLDGTLALVLAGGFTPATGDTFAVLTYASETGSVTIDGAAQSYTASYEATGLAIVAS